MKTNDWKMVILEEKRNASWLLIEVDDALTVVRPSKQVPGQGTVVP